jgi:hypothetical protein
MANERIARIFADLELSALMNAPAMTPEYYDTMESALDCLYGELTAADYKRLGAMVANARKSQR